MHVVMVFLIEHRLMVAASCVILARRPFFSLIMDATFFGDVLFTVFMLPAEATWLIQFPIDAPALRPSLSSFTLSSFFSSINHASHKEKGCSIRHIYRIPRP